MVELCELKLMNNGVDCWPLGISDRRAQAHYDQQVAQLDFDEDQLNSSSIVTDVDEDDDADNNGVDRSSLFASIQLEPSVISTDSMDMSTFRMRCENNKNDYKLTNIFEDSGQWTTTSGIGASMTTTANNSPPNLINAAKRELLLKRLREESSKGARMGEDGNRIYFGQDHFGLALLEQLNSLDFEEGLGTMMMMEEQTRVGGTATVDDEQIRKKKYNATLTINSPTKKKALLDNLLNHNCIGEITTTQTTSPPQMTTWGRLRTTDGMQTPAFPIDDKANSLPELRSRQLANTSQKTADTLQPTATFFLDANNKQQQKPRPVSTNAELLFLPAPPPAATETTAEAGATNSSSQTSCSSSSSSKRPASLVANFVEQQQQQQQLFWLNQPQLLGQNQPQQQQLGVNCQRQQGQPQLDYDYTEVYVGEGRYLDVNENEIGYVPPSTAPIQRGDRWRHYQQQGQQTSLPTRVPSSETVTFPPGATRAASYAHATLTVPASASSSNSALDGTASCSGSAKKQQRTFADLSPSHTAPDLKFLSMSHKVPSLCQSSSTSMDCMLKKAREGTFDLEDEKALLFYDPVQPGSSSLSHQINALNNGPDSGLGSSSSSGPLHIEDWTSLSVLLPRHVVDACSFFKTNASLLTGSDAAQSNNNIEKKQMLTKSSRTNSNASSDKDATSACRTCFSVRRRNCLHPPNWAQSPTTRVLCGCEQPEKKCCSAAPLSSMPTSLRGQQQMGLSKLKLHAHELSIVGLPIYEAKRNLVERVVDGVAEIARGASSVVLFSALERLLADGLLDGFKPWDVIVHITGPGPVTNNIFQIVKTLEASEKPENFRVHHFFREVLKMHSLEGWLSYMILKENILARLYSDTSFLVRANTAYRSLFWRLVESVELLSVLSQCQRNTLLSTSQPNSARCWGSASKLPADSRVPKSSLMPARLTIAFAPVVIVAKSDEKTENTENKTKKQELLKEELASTSASPTTPLADLTPTHSPSASFKSCTSQHSRIPTPSSGSNWSTSSTRPRSRSTLPQNSQASGTSQFLSPTSTLRSRSLLRPSLFASSASKIPVRVFGAGANPMIN
jgi:hypothetical protein